MVLTLPLSFFLSVGIELAAHGILTAETLIFRKDELLFFSVLPGILTGLLSVVVSLRLLLRNRKAVSDIIYRNHNKQS